MSRISGSGGSDGGNAAASSGDAPIHMTVEAFQALMNCFQEPASRDAQLSRENAELRKSLAEEKQRSRDYYLMAHAVPGGRRPHQIAFLDALREGDDVAPKKKLGKKRAEGDKTLGRASGDAGVAASSAAAASSRSWSPPASPPHKPKKPPHCSVCGVLKSDKTTSHAGCRQVIAKRKAAKEAAKKAKK